MYLIIYLILAAAALYFCLRCFLLRRDLRKTSLELREIQKDLAQNRVLHLARPDRAMEQLLESINSILEEIRRERLQYEQREKTFQHQMEHISHDLRTPLTVILGYLKFMDKSEHAPGMTPEQLESLEIIQRKARTLEYLITEIYDFSRLVSQDYKLSLHRVDVCRLLRETFLEHYLLLERSCLRPECRLPDRPLYVSGDSSALERIFSNLFQNAGRYGEHFLNIQWEETPGEIKISFTNDTCSLTSSEATCLFDRFYMQDPARTQGGTGLGLTIAKSLAEAMNGTLTAELTQDSGELALLTLTLTLPRFSPAAS